MDPIQISHIIEACRACNRQAIRAIIRTYRDTIDINTFLESAIDLCQQDATWALTAPIRAILCACRDRIDSDTLNDVFIRACIAKSGLAIVIIRLFIHRLTEESIETALLLCHECSIEACEEIITRTNKLTTRLYVVCFGICIEHSKLGSDRRHLAPSNFIHRFWVRLCNRYEAEIKEAGIKRRYWGRCGLRPCTLLDCCRHENYDMACALIEAYPEIVCEHFFIESIQQRDIEIATLILEQHTSLLGIKTIEQAFAAACANQDSDVINLLLDTVGSDLSQGNYIEAFNEACMRGRPVTLELLLTMCSEFLQFEDKFTFSLGYVKDREDIISLLIKTYGNKLTDQFPSLCS